MYTVSITEKSKVGWHGMLVTIQHTSNIQEGYESNSPTIAKSSNLIDGSPYSGASELLWWITIRQYLSEIWEGTAVAWRAPQAETD